MQQIIENNQFKVVIKQTGAELCSIQSKDTNREYIWQADPAVWGSHSPVLFPVIGQVREGGLSYKEEYYAIPRHGFIRNNNSLTVAHKQPDTQSYTLTDSPETLAVYPFKFRFTISYRLNESTLTITHRVENCNNTEMYFSVGAHPAFNCPITDNESYEDYYLEFDQVENTPTWPLNKDGLVSSVPVPLLENTNTLALTPQLFDQDVLILKKPKSKSITLKSKKSSPQVKVTFPDFTHVGLWAKPLAPFICIEPWLGMADAENNDTTLQNKEGSITLPANKVFEASYSIQISE